MATRRFALIWIPLVLVVGAMVWLIYDGQRRSAETIMRSAERGAVHVATQLGTTELDMVRSDLLFLAEQTAVHASSLGIGTNASKALAATFLSFATNRALYDQVRFINRDGWEVVRVNWNGSHPSVVSDEALQNKSDRAYVRDSLALAPGAIYVSAFDLNVEHGSIEQPLKPMIRFAMPVRDENGALRGVVVLNYLGDRLLQRLRATAGTGGQLWLLNDAGYWLLGPSAADEWRFMFPKQPQTQLPQRDPEAWQAIANGPTQGQFATPGGLYTYSKLKALSPSQGHPVAAKEGWIVVSAVAPAIAFARPWPVSPWLVIVGIALLLAAGVWAVAYYRARRHMAEQQVHASETKFQALLEGAPDAMVIVDRYGQIVLVNAQAEHYFGYKRHEMVGQPVEILVPEALRATHERARAEYSADPYPRAMGDGLDLQARRKDGNTFPVEISLSPLETPSGRLVTASIRDITARKQAERQRAEAQTRYRDLVNNLPVGVYRKTPGPHGRFLEVNPALVAMLEAESAEELMNHPVSDFHRDPAQRALLSERLMAKGIVVNDEMEMVTVKGRAFWGALTAVVKREQDGQVYFDGIIIDVSARKQIEEQLYKRTVELEAINHELEAFSYSVSHDLRAPLRAIDGFSQILLDANADQLDDTGRDYLTRVRRAAQHMGVLIDDLLKLSRVARAEVKRENVDLSALAIEVAEDMRRDHPERPVRFTVAPGLHAEADAGLLRIALNNLLSNAWKFTGKCAEPEVSFGVTTYNAKTVYVISDNGSGFDMRYADKLFGAFQRLHDPHEFPGTGIGLATVQRIIHKHGGRIWADSVLNEGARFYFTLHPEVRS